MSFRKIFYNKWYIEAIKFEEKLESKGWVFLSSGKNRRVWKRGNVVLKIAYVEDGLQANKKERFLYINYRDYFAPCRLIYDNILMMRALIPMDESFDEDLYEMIPEWANQLNDGPQIGMDKNGKILIYDYAEENLSTIAGQSPSNHGGNTVNVGCEKER